MNKQLLKPVINERRTIKQMVANVKDRLRFGNLNQDQKADFEARKSRLVKSGFWS